MLRFMSSTSVVALFAGLVSVARADSITYTFTTIDAPLATSGTALSGINDSGQIVGTYFVNGAGSFGFLDTDGVFAIITPPGAISPGVSGSMTRDRSSATTPQGMVSRISSTPVGLLPASALRIQVARVAAPP
jgi:hypothetical protein